jgi:dephospho-CoA kinase
MPLIYVTGSAGSGKSTVQQELRRRGYDSYDFDAPGISAAHDRDGRIVKVPNARERPPDWFDKHSWRMVDGALERLRLKGETGLVILCGAMTSAEDRGLFDQTIFLDIDERTLRTRLANRTGNDFGQVEQELARILAVHKTLREKYRDKGVAIVDASMPLGEVVDQIVALLPS